VRARLGREDWFCTLVRPRALDGEGSGLAGAVCTAVPKGRLEELTAVDPADFTRSGANLDRLSLRRAMTSTAGRRNAACRAASRTLARRCSKRVMLRSLMLRFADGFMPWAAAAKPLINEPGTSSGTAISSLRFHCASPKMP